MKNIPLLKSVWAEPALAGFHRGMSAIWWSHSLHWVFSQSSTKKKKSRSSRNYNPSLTFTPLKPTISVPEDREPKTHREINPSQSSQMLSSLTQPDVNTWCLFAFIKKKKKQSRKWIGGECLVLFERFVPQRHGFLESALASYLHAWSYLQRQSKIFLREAFHFDKITWNTEWRQRWIKW